MALDMLSYGVAASLAKIIRDQISPGGGVLAAREMFSLTGQPCSVYAIPLGGGLPRGLACLSGTDLVVALYGVEDTPTALNLLASYDYIIANDSGATVNETAIVASVNLLAGLKAAGIDRPGNSLTICGWSWGGAVAHAFARFALRRLSSSVNGAMSFGSPKVGDTAFGKTLGGVTHVRYMLPSDPVPAFPPATPTTQRDYFSGQARPATWAVWKTFGIGKVLEDDGSVTTQSLPSNPVAINATGIVGWLLGTNQLAVNSHSITNYAARLSARAASDSVGTVTRPVASPSQPFLAQLLPDIIPGNVSTPKTPPSVFALGFLQQGTGKPYYAVSVGRRGPHYVCYNGYVLGSLRTSFRARRMAARLNNAFLEWGRNIDDTDTQTLADSVATAWAGGTQPL